MIRTCRKSSHCAVTGFTLLELVLVMLLASVILALVAPSFSGWSRGQRVQDAADQLIAMTRLARTRAASEGVTYRLNLDAQAGTYQLVVQDGDQFQPVQSAQGRQFQLPGDLHIQLQAAGGGASQEPYIDFYPTGRAKAAKVTIRSDRGDSITIECPSPAEGYVIAQAAQGGGR